MGQYSEVMRMNVINSIPNPILVTSHDLPTKVRENLKLNPEFVIHSCVVRC